MEGKGSRVIFGKTKEIQLLEGKRNVSTKMNPALCLERKWFAAQLNVYLVAACDTFICISCLGKVSTDAGVAEFKCGNGHPGRF